MSKMFVNFRKFVKKQVKGVSIRRKKLPNGTSGQVYRQGNKWIIEIEKSTTEEMQCEILLHELAHCVSGSHWHGKKWALGHEKTYKLWTQFIDSDGQECGQVE
jgi:Zn-dependent peptidase ImmA (M78 family)